MNIIYQGKVEYLKRDFFYLSKRVYLHGHDDWPTIRLTVLVLFPFSLSYLFRLLFLISLILCTKQIVKRKLLYLIKQNEKLYKKFKLELKMYAILKIVKISIIRSFVLLKKKAPTKKCVCSDFRKNFLNLKVKTKSLTARLNCRGFSLTVCLLFSSIDSLPH